MVRKVTLLGIRSFIFEVPPAADFFIPEGVEQVDDGTYKMPSLVADGLLIARGELIGFTSSEYPVR